MSKFIKLSIEQFKINLKKTHQDIVIVDELTYKDTHTKAYFIDKEYGEWWAMPYGVTGGRGHPDRKRKLLGDLRRLSEREINKRLDKLFDGKIHINYSTYKKQFLACEFIDLDFGRWQAPAGHVLHGKCLHPKRSLILRRQTNIQKYGFANPSQNPIVALKTARSQNNVSVLYHWKTNEEVVCRGSYEKKVIEYLNENQIDFDFQIPFDMPDGKRYFIDLYLKEQSVWVEIKGYKRLKGMKKWEWFHSEHSNSELWDKQKLKEMKIL